MGQKSGLSEKTSRTWTELTGSTGTLVPHPMDMSASDTTLSPSLEEAEAAMTQPSTSPPSTQSVSTSSHPPPGRARSSTRLRNKAQPRPSSSPLDKEEKENVELRFGARHVIDLVVPVSITMFLALLLAESIHMERDLEAKYSVVTSELTPFGEGGSALFGALSTGSSVLDAIVNALIFLGFIIILTSIIVGLYLCNCTVLVSFILITFMSLSIYVVSANLTVARLFRALNSTLWNWPIMVFWSVNVGVLCPMAVFWKAPKRVQQGAIILGTCIVGMVLSLTLKQWPCWIILGFLALWDIFAVCAPCGPLRLMVNKAAERQAKGKDANFGKGMLYSSMAWVEEVEVSPPESSSTSALEGATPASSLQRRLRLFRLRLQAQNQAQGLDPDSAREMECLSDPLAAPEPQAPTPELIPLPKTPKKTPTNATPPEVPAKDKSGMEKSSTDSSEEEGGSARLGLGDFVFYSVLVVKCSQLGRLVSGEDDAEVDWVTTLGAVVSVLIGLCATLLYLAIKNKPLPALPLSIFAGLVTAFTSFYATRPFYHHQALRQAFV